jgi:hypothetical protein
MVGQYLQFNIYTRSIDDVDKAILEAKTALMELTQDLSERSQRWRQIEMLTGVSIVNNPGILALQRLGRSHFGGFSGTHRVSLSVRHVGGGNRAVRGGLSSRMSSMSVDDLHDDLETRSVAASHTSHLSSRQGGAKRNVFQTSSGRDFSVSRESSKESSNSESDELLMERDNNMALHRNRLVKQQSRVSEVSVGSGVSSISDFQVVSRPEVVRPSDTQSLSGVGGSPGDSPATRR